MKLVDDIRNAASWWSLRFLALAGAIEAAWKTLPPEALAVVPDSIRGWIVFGLIICAAVARVIKQDLPK